MSENFTGEMEMLTPPTPTPAPENEWDAIVRDLPAEEPVQTIESAEADTAVALMLEDERQGQIRALGKLFEASGFRSPDKHAQVLTAARITGAPTEIVEANLEGFKKAAEQAQWNPVLFHEQNPILTRIILDRPDAAPILTDREQLGRIAKLVSTLRQGLYSLGASSMGVPPIGRPEWQQQLEAMAKTEEQLRETGREVERGPPSDRSFLDAIVGRGWHADFGNPFALYTPANAPKGFTVDEPPLWWQALSGSARETQRNLLGFQMLESGRADQYDLQKRIVDLENARRPLPETSFPESWIIEAIKFVPFMAVTSGGSLIAGPYGSFGATFAQLAGGAYLDLKEKPLDNGQPMPEGVAAGAAALYGALAAGMMSHTLPQVLKAWGPLGEFVSRRDPEGFAQALMRDATLPHLALDYGRQVFHSANSMARQMAFQTLVEDATTYVARNSAAYGGELGRWGVPDIPSSLERAAEAAIAAWEGSIVAGIPATMTRFAVDLSMIGEALRERTGRVASSKVKAIFEFAKGNKAVAAIPNELARLVSEHAADTGLPVERLWLDAKALPRLFQTDDASWEATARQLGGDKLVSDIKAAALHGEKIPISLPDFLEKWASKPTLMEQVGSDFSTEPYLPTIREQAEMGVGRVDDIIRVAHDLDESKTPPESEAEVSLVNAVRAAAAKAGEDPTNVEHTANLYRAIARTMAARFNRGKPEDKRITEDAMFEHVEIQVRRSLEGESSGVPPEAGAAAPAAAEGVAAQEAGASGAQAPERPQLYQSVALREGTESLEPYGLTLTKRDDWVKRNTVRQIGVALERRTREQFGTIPRGVYTTEALGKLAGWMAKEAAFELQPENRERSALGWYSTKYQRSLDVMGERFPELLHDKAARDMFTLFAAIASDGEEVTANFRLATDLYSDFATTGSVATKATYRPAVAHNLLTLQQLYETYGNDLHLLLTTEATVKELRKFCRDNGLSDDSSYKSTMKLPLAAAIFGPKIGVFYANLMGMDGYLTMDRWWSRMFNRQRGSLVTEPTRKSLEKFKEALGDPKMDDEEAIINAHFFAREWEDAEKGESSALAKAGNTITKAVKGLQDVPFNASDREFMVNAAKEAQRLLKEQGHEVSIADLQAVLWYYEKRLYGEQGYKSNRGASDISYEEIARRIVDEGRVGGGRERPAAQVAGKDSIAGPDGVPIELPRASPALQRTLTQLDLPAIPGILEKSEAVDFSQRLRDRRERERLSRQTYAELLERVRQPDGGFTYRPQTDSEPKTGYALSIHPERSQALDVGALTLDSLLEYVEKNGDLLEQKGMHLGAWHDPASGKVFLDVSQVTENEAEASALALSHDQKAYFDLGRGQSVTINPNATSGGVVGVERGAEAQPPPRQALPDVARAEGGGPGPALPAAHGEGAGAGGGPGRAAADLLRILEQAGWHGTPHRFDKFQLIKIGEGQGAQSFGWGLYFSENPLVAQHYKQELSPLQVIIDPLRVDEVRRKTLGGFKTPEVRQAEKFLLRSVEAGSEQKERILDSARYFAEQDLGIVRQQLGVGEGAQGLTIEHGTYGWQVVGPSGLHQATKVPYGIVHQTKAEAEAALKVIQERVRKTDPERMARLSLDAQQIERALALLKELDPQDVEVRQGYLYKAQIPEHDVLLDYASGLSDQPPKVRAALAGVKPGDLGLTPVKANGEWWWAHVVDGIGERLNLISADSEEALRTKWEPGWRNLNGREMYDTLSETLGSSQKASEFLRDRGVPGLRYLDQGSRAGGKEGTHNFVIWDENEIKILRRLAQEEAKGGGPAPTERIVRGFTRFWQEGVKRIAEIVLTKDANLSTLAHESAHVFLDLFSELANHPDAPESLTRDWKATLGYLGVKDLAELQSEKGRAANEKWARTFEAYLREGKAPSAKLVRTFQRFRLWLQSIYSSASGVPGAQLSPEIRGVFDRLLATDREIENQSRAMGFDRPIFQTPEQAGMSPAAFADYLEATKKALSHAAETARVRVLKDQLRETEAWWKDEVKKLQPEIEKEFDSMPAVRAYQLLRNGKSSDEPALAALSGPINRMALLRDLHFSQDLREPVLRMLKGRVAADGDVAPMEIAKALGFKSTPEMLRAILALPDRDRYVEDRVGQEMASKHGDVAKEPGRLRAEVGRALHGGFTMDVLMREFHALTRRVADQPAPPIDALKQAARALVGRMPVADLDTARVLERERTAADEAFEAVAKGEYKRALVAKQQQLLNALMHHFVEGGLILRDKFQALLGQVTQDENRARISRGSPEMLAGVDVIAEAVGARLPPPKEELARRPSFDAVLFAMVDKGVPPGFDTDVVRGVLADGPSGKLTVDQMIEVDAAVRQMRQLANSINSVNYGEAKIAREQLLADIASESSSLNVQRPFHAASTTAAHWWSRQNFTDFAAALTDPQLMFERLGPTAAKFFWGGYLRARNEEAALQKEITKEVVKLWEHVPKAERAKRYDMLPDDVLPLREGIRRDQNARDRLWLIMVALNFGNESNRDRLLGGYGWTEEQVKFALEQHLTHGEMGFVQKVWDLLDQKLYPMVERHFTEVNGIAPEKIRATPFALTIDGEKKIYRGGYFPARYDPEASRSDVGIKQEEAAIQRIYGGSSAPISVLRSFTKNRARNFVDVIDLNWNVVPGHIFDVLHYVTHDSLVRDAFRVMNTNSWRDSVQRSLGLPYEKQLNQWLKVVATGRAEPGLDWARAETRFLGAARSRFSMATLGGNIAIMLNDLTQPLDAVMLKEVHPFYATVSMLEGATGVGWFNMRQRALKLSKELPVRAEEARHHLEEALSETGRRGMRGPVKKAWDFTQESAYYGYRVMEAITSTVVWDARFRQEMARHGDQARAVEAADTVIQHLYASGMPAEQPAILRNKSSVGTLLVFYSFFNKRFNAERRLWHPVLEDFARAEGIGKLKVLPTAGVAAGYTLGSLLAFGAMAELLNGRGPYQDEELPDWLLRKTVASAMMLFPLGGEVAGVWEWAVSPKGTVPKPSERGAPLFSVISKLTQSAIKAFDENSPDFERVMAAGEALAFLSKLPVSQPKRTLKYMVEPQDTSPAGIASGLVYGERENQPSNLFTIWGR